MLKVILIVVKDLFILYSQYHGSWWPNDIRKSAAIAVFVLVSQNILLSAAQG